MGTEQSKPSERYPQHVPHYRERQPRSQFSETDVAELLERQKQHFDQKIKQLQKEQKSPPATTTQQSPFEYGAGSSNTAGPSSSSHQSTYSPRGVTPVQISPPTTSERLRTPYNYTHTQLKQATGLQATTLYPNLQTAQAQSNVAQSTSDFVFVSNTGNVQRCVPSAPPAPRVRSTSRPPSREPNSKRDSDNEMKCPTCKKMYGLTIFQCAKGHSSCHDCKRYRSCGLCHQPITDMRNITLEALIAEMKVKCPNEEEGCNLFMKMADIENHAKECPFRELPCPLAPTFGCFWKGKLSQVAPHFDHVHPMNRQAAVDTEMTLPNPQNNCHIAQLVIIGNFNFVFHLIVSQEKKNMYLVVQLIGTNISASKWIYEIHVYHKGQPRRKYQYSDICYPINTSMNEIMSEAKCAVLPLSYASTFVCDNKINYKFYIKNEKPFGRNNRGRGGHRK
ncbi:E3 ubiquitin-protein ligase Siah1 isoform X1 [Amyelois transitella]|uniref:E3 ubiquitin-protein ligase Siah1 isoform X1 n=1 Tax=Amyelois transitella TaxID=680683 RepID=UPI00298FA97E|nr:E3 ubiquitin-protein ligase Siah1 isoform X1 [Amyelois transitella]